MKPLTEKQARRLLVLARRGTVLSPGKRDWSPLLRRGLVEPDPALVGKTPHDPYLPPLRITPAGYRALADDLERHGWPNPTDAQEGTA